MRKRLQIPPRSGIIKRKTVAREEICLYYSTNAKNAKRDLKSWCASTRIKWFAPIAAAKRSAIIRARCIRRRARRARNARETAKPAADADKVKEKVG